MLSDVQREEREAQAQHRRLERARKAKARKAAQRKQQRPRRLAQIERRREQLGAEYKRLPAYPKGQQRRMEIRRELEDLGRQRLELKYGGES